jgi:hypothetical protein
MAREYHEFFTPEALKRELGAGGDCTLQTPHAIIRGDLIGTYRVLMPPLRSGKLT